MKDMKSAVRDRYAAHARAGSCCSGSQASGSTCCSGASATPLGCGIPLRHAELQPGETVLDLGCGPGIEVLAAARAVGPGGKVIGVDMTPEMIESARERVAGSAANVELLLADIEVLPLGPESVDVIVSNCVINLAPDKGRVFREMHRVLRPGGRFSVSDMVTHGRVPEALRANPELWAACVSGAVEEKEYLALLEGAGFTGIAVHDAVEYGPLADSAGDCRLLSITVTGVKARG